MFLIQIAFFCLSQLFKTVSLRSVNFLSFTLFTYLLMKRGFLKCLTPAFLHSVIPFHDSSPWFHGTVSKVQSASALARNKARTWLLSILLQLLNCYNHYLSSTGWDKFVTRKVKCLSLIWLFYVYLSDCSAQMKVKNVPAYSLHFLTFQHLGTICSFSVLLRHFPGFFSSLQCLFAQWWFRTENYERGKPIRFPPTS